MNRSSPVLLAAMAIGFGAVIYFKEQTIAGLRRGNASMQKGVAELTTQAERDRAEIERLREQIEVFKKESEQLRTRLAEEKATPKTPATAAADSPATAESGGGGQFMKGLAKMFADPEMKKSMRVQQLVGIRMIYGDLTKELGLTGADAEQLLEILADRQMDISASAMANLDPNAPDKDAKAKKIADTRERYTEQLQAVLGEERYKKFQTYEGSIGDRFLLQQSEGQFAAVGAPLEPAQKEKLLTFMREERAKTPPGSSNLMNTTDPQKQFEAIQSDEAIGQFVASQEEFNRRVMARARAMLNVDQIATLEKVQQQQIELLKTQMKMSREFLGVGK